jgi:hypothetical protein
LDRAVAGQVQVAMFRGTEFARDRFEIFDAFNVNVSAPLPGELQGLADDLAFTMALLF